MATYTNAQIHSYLKDATEEISKLNGDTVWKQLGPANWKIEDDERHLLGWVTAKICLKTAKVKFFYKHNRNDYFNISRVASVTVDVVNWTDATERQKLSDFDDDIADAHGL